MADRPRRRQRRDDAPNALLASAAQVTDDRKSAPKYERWQDEAWARYDELGELRSGVTWHGNVLSRARLVAAYAPESPGDTPTPVELPDPDEPNAKDEKRDPDQLAADQTAVELVRQIASGIGGQSELLRSAAVHLDVPGEGWFVGAVEGKAGVETDNQLDDVAWRFYSADELKRRQDADRVTYEVEVAEGVWRDLGADVLPVRVWKPHERRHWKADSACRAALGSLAELSLINRRIIATMQSRLASNGIYWIPSEITFPPNPQYKDAPDPFIAELQDLGATAIRTPGSAAAALPLYARAPAQYIEKLRHDKFFDAFDEHLIQLREQTIHSIAGHFDWPAEVLLGLGDLNHWGAWAVEESSIKTTVTPFLELVVWALTTGYYRPALEAAGIPPDDYVVWFDVSDLVVRPDRSHTTMDAYDRDIASSNTTLREIGLNDDDAPNEEELRRKHLVKLLDNPTLAPQAAAELGLFKNTGAITSVVDHPGPPGGGNGNGNGNGAVPQTEPVQGPPATDQAPAPSVAPTPRRPPQPASRPATPAVP